MSAPVYPILIFAGLLVTVLLALAMLGRRRRSQPSSAHTQRFADVRAEPWPEGWRGIPAIRSVGAGRRGKNGHAGQRPSSINLNH